MLAAPELVDGSERLYPAGPGFKSGPLFLSVYRDHLSTYKPGFYRAVVLFIKMGETRFLNSSNFPQST